MSFADLGLPAALLQALQRLGFDTPTAIQTLAIPPALQGRDLLACAQTGSGKTLAYGLPLLQALQNPPAAPQALATAKGADPATGTAPQTDAGAATLGSAYAARSAPSRRGLQRQARALVLVPTRELAVQVGQALRDLANQLPQDVRVSVVFGGVSINPQRIALGRGSDLLVATPGRLLDLCAQKALTLSQISTLVLDEADRLLDLGFAAELEQLLAMLPQPRQNYFFSATFGPAVRALAHTLLRAPLELQLPVQSAPPDITQQAYAVDANRRTQLLRHLFTQRSWSRVLVFVASKHAAEIVADKLRKAGLKAEPLHGALSQGKRSQVLADFKAARVQLVIATDLAARGLDIVDLPVVLNYDLPRASDDFIHRMGRTGRAGASGLAVSFVSATTAAHFRLISKRNSLHCALQTEPGFEPQDHAATPDAPASGAGAAAGTGGVKGLRPSKKDRLRALAAQANT